MGASGPGRGERMMRRRHAEPPTFSAQILTDSGRIFFAILDGAEESSLPKNILGTGRGEDLRRTEYLAASIMGFMLEDAMSGIFDIHGVNWRSDPRLKRFVRAAVQRRLPRKMGLSTRRMTVLLLDTSAHWRTFCFHDSDRDLSLVRLSGLSALLRQDARIRGTWDADGYFQRWRSQLTLPELDQAP